MLVAALMLAIYGGVLAGLATDWWNDPGASQGLLIPPLAIYIFWVRRGRTFAFPAAGDNRGLWAVGFACAMFLGGKVGAEFFLMRLSMVLLLAALALLFWGAERLKTLTFPLVLLATMIPLPAIVYNALAAPLQLFASGIATDLAQAAGVTVYRDGNVIHLANVSLGVAEACSGLRSLSSLIVASLLLGFLQCTRVRTRVTLFALSIPLAIAVNVLRVSGTAVLADYNETFAMGFYHSFSGWLVFMVGFAAVWAIAAGLHRWTERS